MTRTELRALFDPVLAGLDDPAQRAEWSWYLDYHARRYATLMEVVASVAAQRVLNVGPMFETHLLRSTGATVDTLGFANPPFAPREGERHIEADLNQLTSDGDESYDAIVMAEVIEHLHTSPVLVLRDLASWLRPGGTLIVQTPNAVALHKRVRMAAGRNPLEPIREDASNPGHFHEYTLAELTGAARAAGLEPAGVRAENYFGASRGARAYAALGRVVPRGLRHGFTVWMRRPA
jgi:SAM-dependent methyltransferase